MCNLYQMTPKEDVERYVRRVSRQITVPEFDATKPVAPFGLGLLIRPGLGDLEALVGQWGMIRPGAPSRIELIQPKPLPGKKAQSPRPKSTNNARIEGISAKPTFSESWKTGRRCLVPATWYAEPNWETGKNIWWHLRRADGLPWFIAGLWSEWTDPGSGEIVPNFTMITRNCTGHPLLGRLHKPEADKKTGLPLAAELEDKRSLVHICPEDWDQWFHGTTEDAKSLLQLQPVDVFDQADALRTDEALVRKREAQGSLGF